MMLEILPEYPDGIQVRDLKAKIMAQASDLNPGTIQTVISDFTTESPHIRRVARGVVALADVTEPSPPPVSEISFPATSEQRAEIAREARFYEPFAAWVVDEADEATEAVVLGGAGLRVKWGTPDVIGVYKPRPSDLVKFPVEIISAEVKTDPIAAIVAFGQAISYRLFSHKTIIVMTDAIENNQDANARLKSLCHLFGVGYVLFDRDKPDNPNFRLIVPPRRFDPDMYYVNEFAAGLVGINRAHFDKLFR
jgi:hypothetical protein